MLEWRLCPLPDRVPKLLPLCSRLACVRLSIYDAQMRRFHINTESLALENGIGIDSVICQLLPYDGASRALVLYALLAPPCSASWLKICSISRILENALDSFHTDRNNFKAD